MKSVKLQTHPELFCGFLRLLHYKGQDSFWDMSCLLPLTIQFDACPGEAMP